MYRVNGAAKVVVENAATVSQPFNVGPMAAGRIHNATAADLALTFSVSPTKDGTYHLLTDDAGAAVALAVPLGTAVPMPPTLYEGSGYAKLLLAGVGSVREFIVSQTA